MAKKKVKGEKSKKKESPGKSKKGKSYTFAFACGKTVKLDAPKVWDRGWKQILDLARQTEEGQALPVRYVCGKCKRRSPVKSYLCKAKKLDET